MIKTGSLNNVFYMDKQVYVKKEELNMTSFIGRERFTRLGEMGSESEHHRKRIHVKDY